MENNTDKIQKKRAPVKSFHDLRGALIEGKWLYRMTTEVLY